MAKDDIINRINSLTKQSQMLDRINTIKPDLKKQNILNRINQQTIGDQFIGMETMPDQVPKSGDNPFIKVDKAGAVRLPSFNELSNILRLTPPEEPAKLTINIDDSKPTPELRAPTVSELKYWDSKLDPTDLEIPGVIDYIKVLDETTGNVVDSAKKFIDFKRGVPGSDPYAGDELLDNSAKLFLEYQLLTKGFALAGRAAKPLLKKLTPKLLHTELPVVGRWLRRKINKSIKYLDDVFPNNKPAKFIRPPKELGGTKDPLIVNQSTKEAMQITSESELKRSFRQQTMGRLQMSKDIEKTMKFTDNMTPTDIEEQIVKAKAIQSLERQAVSSSKLKTNFIKALEPGKPIELPQTGEPLTQLSSMTRTGVRLRTDVLNNMKTNEIWTADAWLLDTERFAVQLDKGSTGIIHDELVYPMRLAEINSVQKSNVIKQNMREMIEAVGLNLKDSTPLRLFVEKKVIPTDPVKKKAYSKAATWLRNNYDDLLDKLNKSRTSQNKPIIPRRKDYITHTQELDMLNEIYKGLDNVPETVGFRFGKQRLDAIPEDQLKGAFEAFETYSDTAYRTLETSPIVAKLRGYATEPSTNPGIAQFLNFKADELSLLPDYKASTPAEQFVVRGLKGATSRFISNAVVWNFGTLAAQFAGTVQTAALLKQPIAAPARAIFKNLPQEIGRIMVKKLSNPAYETFAGKFSLVYKGRVLQKIPELRAASGFMEKMGQEMLEFFDRTMVSSAFDGTYKKVVKQVGHDQAIKIADSIASRAQAEMIRSMRPHFLNTFVGRTVSPLQTFVFSNLNLVRKDIIGAGIRDKSILEPAKMMGSLLGATIVANSGFKLMTGRNKITWQDFVPGLGSAKFGGPGVLKYAFGLFSNPVNTVADLPFMFLLPFGGLQAKRLLKTGAQVATGEQPLDIATLKSGIFGGRPQR